MKYLLVLLLLSFGSLSFAEANHRNPNHRFNHNHHNRSFGCIPGVNCRRGFNRAHRYVPQNYYWTRNYGWVPPAYYRGFNPNLVTAWVCRRGYNWCRLNYALPAGSLCRCSFPTGWFDGVATYN